jgi:hypothetical protein
LSGDCETTFWATVDEALEAERTLAFPRCGPLCAGQHMVVFESGGHVRVARGYRKADPPVKPRF